MSETAKEQARIYGSHMMPGQTAPVSAPGLKARWRGVVGGLRERNRGHSGAAV